MKEFLLEHREFITKFVEISAALAGSFYLKRTGNQKLKIFVYYLWLTVIVEFIGKYPMMMQNDYDYDWFISLKNSPFASNTWLYNIYSYLAIGLLGIFYSDLITNRSFKITIRFIFVGYSLFVFWYYTFTDAFFQQSLNYDFILASLIIGVYIILYFIELIRSDYLLDYYKLPTFYISMALLIWYICATPLFIFGNYFKAINENFVTFRKLALLLINIFTYLWIVFGFLFPLHKDNQLTTSK